jgi:phosphinothricin acetyltransferase
MYGVEIRDATAADAATISAIYAQEVLTGFATFDVEPPPVGHWAELIGSAGGAHHVLVAVVGDAVVGYAKSGTFRPRPAYDTTVETSIYLQRRGVGIGTALYSALFERLDGGPAHLCVANISLPNDASLRLHERFGFLESGTLHEVGRKFGEWHDVVCYQRPLR